MKAKAIFIPALFIICLCNSISVNSAMVASVANGNWSDPATWDCACVPATNDAVTINNNVTLTADVTLNPVGTLTLAAGELNTNGFTITIDNTSTSAVVRDSGLGHTGYIAGTLKWDLGAGATGPHVYPVGSAARYRPVTITPGTGPHKLSVEFRDMDPNLVNAPCTCNTNDYDLTLNAISTNYYWYVDSYLGGDNITLTFTYGDDDPGINEVDPLLTARWSGAVWTNMGGYSQNTVLNTLETQSFGHGTFGAYDFAGAPGTGLFPVTYVGFNGSVSTGKVLLKWSTASETNNKGFDVERSGDGKIYSMIGYVNGAGTTSIQQNYQFADDALKSSGTYFYRLKQTDYDGQYAYSSVIEIFVDTGMQEFTISNSYPNPVASGTTKINVSLPSEGEVTCMVYSVTGQKVKEFKINQPAGDHTLEIDTSTLSPGAYLYSISFKMKTITGKFVRLEYDKKENEENEKDKDNNKEGTDTPK